MQLYKDKCSKRSTIFQIDIRAEQDKYNRMSVNWILCDKRSMSSLPRIKRSCDVDGLGKTAPSSSQSHKHRQSSPALTSFFTT